MTPWQFARRYLVAVPAVSFLIGVACGADHSTVIQGKDKRSEITLPGGWEPAELQGVAEKRIQAKCTAKNAFVVVISEAKLKTVKEYAKAILAINAKNAKLKNRTISEPKELKINGVNAIQYEIRATVDSTNFVFLKTFIESPKYWHHVDAWTTPSHWDEVQEDLRAINESVKEQPKAQ